MAKKKEKAINPTFIQTQEEIKIEIGKTATELLGKTTQQNMAELEAQFTEVIDDDNEVDPVIVEHVMRAIDKILDTDDYKQFEKEDYLRAVTETVLESMGIAQTLTKDDKERISVATEKYLETPMFRKALAEKILPKNTDDSDFDDEEEQVLLITQNRIVNTVDNTETTWGQTHTKAAKADNATVPDGNAAGPMEHGLARFANVTLNIMKNKVKEFKDIISA